MTDWSAYFSVADAAEELGLSKGRVRALIDARVLVADKVAGRWLVSPESVLACRNNQRRPGRPLAPSFLWDLINSGFIAKLLIDADAVAQHNIRVQLSNRAEINDVYVLPQRIEKGVHPIIAPGGRALAELAELPAGRDLRWKLDAYIHSDAVEELRRNRTISSTKGDPNVRLRVVDDIDMALREVVVRRVSGAPTRRRSVTTPHRCSPRPKPRCTRPSA